MTEQKETRKLLQTKVLLLSKRRCAVCFGLNNDQAVKKGQIAHIDQNRSNNSLENLIFLCLEHHDEYDSQTSQSKGLTEAELRKYRLELYESLGSDTKKLKAVQDTAMLTKENPNQEVLKDIWDDVYHLVFSGLVPEEIIASNVIEMYSEDYDSNLVSPYVVAITQRLLSEHRKQQRIWPSVTDCDRLDSAFAELESREIVCRQNFADCQNCGYRDIWKEISKEKRKGKKVRGFTFFDEQDTEHVIDDGNLYLCYGSVLSSEAADIKIAKEIVDAIRNHGLEVDWNNTIGQRIRVVMEWRRGRLRNLQSTSKVD
ncbi:MAG: HNH endonuclease signature motif containing protein [Candidatus Kryptoniota bacterium]